MKTATSWENASRFDGRQISTSTRFPQRSGTSTSDPSEIPISKRTKYLNDTPNYRHFLIDKKFGKRAGISTDFTTAAGAHTWRQAINLKTPELRVVDTVIFENYERTNHNAD